MSRTKWITLIITFMLLLGLTLSACQPKATEAPAEEAPAEEEPKVEEPKAEEPALATATAVSRLLNQPGRAIVTARGNHFVIDSVPPLGGPNEEVNPLDLTLAALGSCGAVIMEKAAIDNDIPLDHRCNSVKIAAAVGIVAGRARLITSVTNRLGPVFGHGGPSVPTELTPGRGHEQGSAEDHRDQHDQQQHGRSEDMLRVHERALRVHFAGPPWWSDGFRGVGRGPT